MRKPVHRFILAPAPRTLAAAPKARSLAALALGLGLTAAAAVVLGEARRVNGKTRSGTGRGGVKANALGLRRREQAAAGVQRMTLAQLDFAILTLERGSTGELDLTVHETRKAIKRVRTLQRLRRDASTRKRREHRKAVLREAASALSGARDAQVALHTLEGLMRRHRRLAGSPGVARLRAALLTEHAAAQRALEQAVARERALRLLRAAREQIAADSVADGSRREAQRVAAGLPRIHRNGCKAMRRARKRTDVAATHEWRKRVKDLRHASEALDRLSDDGRKSSTPPAKQKRLRRVARRADRLGETLGEEHDLALLAARVRIEDELFRGDGAARKALLRHIERRRKRLRKRAFKAGALLYDRSQQRFLKRLPTVR